MAKYTKATHESIKSILEYHEIRKTETIGLNAYLVRLMIDEIEEQQKRIEHLTNNISFIMQPNPDSEPE